MPSCSIYLFGSIQLATYAKAIKHNLELLGKLDPIITAAEVRKLFPESDFVRYELEILGQSIRWYWEKKGFQFVDSLKVLQGNSFSEMWGTNEKAFMWKQKFLEEINKINAEKERKSTLEFVEKVAEQARIDGKAGIGINQNDIRYYEFKLGIKRSNLNASAIVKLINDQLGSSNSKSKRINIPESTRSLVLERDNYTCRNCGVKQSEGFTMHVDHIIPVSKGGNNEMENLQTLCPKCNSQKHDH
jgi:5-methylcytosine-specific restriction protein A